MRSPRLFAACFSLALVTAHASAAEPIFTNDFEQAAADKLPEGLTVIAGGFTVREEGGSKLLELPGSPLDTFGLLFGPAQPAGAGGVASARFFGTKTGRKFPTFGVSLGGVGGYRLQVSPGKKALEIFKGDEPQTSVPFEWASGAWTQLRLQIRKAGEGSVVEGKAWPADAPEPEKWTITFDAKEAPPAGRAGLWGSPYAGTPIRFDDLKLEAAPQ